MSKTEIAELLLIIANAIKYNDPDRVEMAAWNLMAEAQEDSNEPRNQTTA